MKLIKAFGQFINDLFEVHKLVRRSLVVFAGFLVGWTTYILYSDLTIVNTAIVSLHTITVGILSMAVGKYFVDRSNESAINKRTPKGKGHTNE